MRLIGIFISILLGAILIAGCTPTALESLPTDLAVTPETSGDGNNGDSNPVETPILSSGEVPQSLFDTVFTDLLDRTGSDRATVTIEKAEGVQWNDGSLGCPEPGVMYTQAIVPGYQVIFSVDGETYDYHLSERGQFILCDNSRSVPPVGVTK